MSRGRETAATEDSPPHSRPGSDRRLAGVQDSPMARRSSLSLGILALFLWAVSWSWLVGAGLLVVRVGEIGAVVAGIAAVVVGATRSRRSSNAGLWCGVVALLLVFALNVLALVLR